MQTYTNILSIAKPAIFITNRRRKTDTVAHRRHIVWETSLNFQSVAEIFEVCWKTQTISPGAPLSAMFIYTVNDK